MIYTLRKTIYISGPMLSQGHPYLNIRKAVLLAEYAYERGWAPIVPHLDSIGQMITGNTKLSRYLETDFSVVSQCDAMLLSGEFTREYDDHGNPTGTAMELNIAEIFGVPVYTKETLPEAKPYQIDSFDGEVI